MIFGIPQQKVLIKIAEKNNKAYVRDMVPVVFKHYSSFYKVLLSLKKYVKSQKDIEGKTFYMINVNACFITANMLLKMGEKGV